MNSLLPHVPSKIEAGAAANSLIRSAIGINVSNFLLLAPVRPGLATLAQISIPVYVPFASTIPF